MRQPSLRDLPPAAPAFGSPDAVRGSTDELERVNRDLQRQVEAQAQIHLELQRQKSLLELMKAVAISANQAHEVDDAIRTCLDCICDFTGWPVGHVYLPSEEEPRVLVCSGLWRVDDPARFRTFRQVSEATKFPVGVDLPGRVAASGNPEWIVDVTEDPSFIRARWAPELDVRSGFAFPILIGTESVGVFEFYSPESCPPNLDLLEIMANIGTQIGRVIERKRAERELSAARDAALEASRLKSAFLANMSHEIRTPLNIILGYNAIIYDRFPSGSPERGLLEGIDRASTRLMETIHSILDLSKIETRTFRIDKMPIDLPALVRKQVDDFQVLAREKGLRLACEIGESDAAIRFDEYCLTHSLMNLLQNAIKFTEKGEVVVRVYRGSDFALRLEVRDTGVGIDPAYLPHVFSPFTQEEAGYARRYEGSGLGLALTRNYLELNDATVSVRSEKGSGTTFTIEFSKGSELWTTESVPAATKSAAPPVEATATKPLVLVVEDDPDTLVYMQALLRTRYEVLGATNGRDVRRLLGEHPGTIRIVLMDLSLCGDEDGLTITSELRRRPDWKHIPIIAVTAHAFADDRRRALAAGCDAYVAKPFSHQELLTTMDGLMGPVHGCGSAISI